MTNENTAVDQSQLNGSNKLNIQVPPAQIQLHLFVDLMQCLSQTELLIFQDDLQAVVNSWLRKKGVVRV